MVSADNVNYDVLAFIFAFLRSNDLVSAALVSKSFKAGAIPRLYRSVHFRLDQMKRWPRVSASYFSSAADTHLL
jgi:F-box-like